MFLQMFALIMFSILFLGCAGFPLPFTEYRALDMRVESERIATNVDCTSLTHLNSVAAAWEGQHLKYIRSQDDTTAIDVQLLVSSLGEKCRARFKTLSIPDIKNELFGDIQTIADSSKLRELGGVSFDYEDVSTRSGIEVSLHLRQHSRGPSHRLVAIYRLADNKVIHYNYSGTNNVDSKRRRWPIDEFFRALVGTGMKAAIP